MELYKEILLNLLAEDTIAQIVESECYKALQKIKAVLHEDSLDDAECFQKIEEIICIFEELGSSGGPRHDFG